MRSSRECIIITTVLALIYHQPTKVEDVSISIESQDDTRAAATSKTEAKCQQNYK